MVAREPHPPLRPIGGYLPIEDHGLIGDGRTCALVACDGSIPWLCVPRFDGPAVFSGILDRQRGGALRTAPAGLRGGRQRYRGMTGVLETDLDGPEGRVRLIDSAAEAWREPDHGIWEVRSSERTFTYSAAMCQVALDRGARIADRLGLPGDAPRWRSEADRIVEALLEEAWDEDRKALREQLGGGALDASILSLPLRRVVPARHPKMVATVEAVVAELGCGDGLLYRYLPDRSPDGLEGDEGAFLLCSFWLVDNLTLQGRLDEAGELFESLCARGGELGLLPEQIDPPTGAFLGNYPQAFSHVGVISSAINLDRHLRGEEGFA